MTTNNLSTRLKTRVFSTATLSFFSTPLPEKAFVKEFNRYPPPTPPQGRGALTCKEISSNSLRNYTSCIVYYELITIQHSTFHIKNYASCIVHYELTTIQHSAFHIKNYTLCIVHYELKQSHITPVLWFYKPQHPVDYNKKLSYLHNNSTTIKP